MAYVTSVETFLSKYPRSLISSDAVGLQNFNVLLATTSDQTARPFSI